jgi:cell division protein FtsB
MKWFTATLLVILALLQYRLWVGEGSLAHIARLEADIEQQQAENERLVDRNKVLAVEVEALKNGSDSVEERAREDMGMIRKGETFYMVVEDEEG